jgi:hypothetical protein
MSDNEDLFNDGEKEEYNEEDDLYASYDAFKALMNAGLTRREAMERTGLDEETLQMLEQEEDIIDFKNDAKEVWDDEENLAYDEKFMSSDDLGGGDGEDDEWGGGGDDNLFDDMDDYGSGKGGGGGWDDFE